MCLTGCGATVDFAQSDYDEQLAPANSEDLPTTHEKVDVRIRSFPNIRNAALVYQEITKQRLFGGEKSDIAELISKDNDPRTLDQTASDARLAEFAKAISLLDKAAALPGSNSQRDWILVPGFSSRDERS